MNRLRISLLCALLTCPSTYLSVYGADSQIEPADASSLPGDTEEDTEALTDDVPSHTYTSYGSYAPYVLATALSATAILGIAVSFWPVSYLTRPHTPPSQLPVSTITTYTAETLKAATGQSSADTSFPIIPTDTLQAAQSIYQQVQTAGQSPKIIVLNFANRASPRSAQEGALCNGLPGLRTSLQALCSTKSNYLGHFDCAYTPNLTHKGSDLVVSVISAGAYNMPSEAGEAGATGSNIYMENLRKKWRMVLARAAQERSLPQEHSPAQPVVVILGAWGCGVFGNNPTHVAQAAKEVLQERAWGVNVVFAIPKDNTGNLKAFENVFPTKTASSDADS